MERGAIQASLSGLEGRWGKYFVCRSVRKEGDEGSREGRGGAGKWMFGRSGGGCCCEEEVVFSVGE